MLSLLRRLRGRLLRRSDDLLSRKRRHLMMWMLEGLLVVLLHVLHRL